MNLTRITRLLKLLQTLQSGKGQNADGLAKACRVSRRTIFRDLEALRGAGVPLKFSAAEERYHIPTAFFLPPTNFTAEEALSIIALASNLGDKRIPFLGPARQAALKLESSLPGSLREQLRTITQSIQLNLQQVNPLEDKQEIYQRLVDALAKRRVVRICYDSLTEWEQIRTKLRPYHLLFSQRSWYVIGRSSLHKAIRTFNLGRIVELKMLREKYAVPRNFSLEKYLGNAWHLIPDAGREQNVHVHFQPLVARNVAEVVWHKSQQLAFREDGSLDFRVRVSGLQEIAWWILGYGDQAEVIKPAKLRKIIAGRVNNMQTLYNRKG
ncbi:MAG: WYL domain-containing protein [Pirellulales bacterium]|nr:WYL domain-containing protein [Pirellulales bacterium]